MRVRDRECYLGASSKLGISGKNGKINKSDWYKEPLRLKKIDKDSIRKINLKEKDILNQILDLKK